MSDKGNRTVPPSVAQFAVEQLLEVCTDTSGLDIVGYLRADLAGNPEWSEDCVCAEAVYPNYDDDESISMPICRLADAQAEIVKRDARIEELEAENARQVRITSHWQEKVDTLETELTPHRIASGRAMAQQPSGVVLPERIARPSTRTIEAFGYVNGWNTCIDEVARLNPCRAQSVTDGYVLVPVNSTEAMRDAIDLLCDDSAAFDDSEAFWHYLLAAAPSTQQKESGDE